MYNSTFPLYCKRMAQLIDGIAIDSPDINFFESELDFGGDRDSAKVRVHHLEGATFKNKDSLSSSKLRELEMLLMLPWWELLLYIERLNKRYTLLSENGIELHPKETFFQLASRNALALVLDKTDKDTWKREYPHLTLAYNDEYSPKNWKSTHVGFVALVEFLVRELSLSSTVIAWNAQASKDDILQDGS